jgi:hypothetical protein
MTSPSTRTTMRRGGMLVMRACPRSAGMLILTCGVTRISVLRIGGNQWKEPSSPHTTPMSVPSGTKRRTCRPTTRSSRPRRSHWTLPRSAASSAASPGSRSRCSSRRSADHGSQRLGDHGGVDLGRVRRPAGADPRRRAPGNSRAPLVVGLVLSHPTVSSADPAPDRADVRA